MSTESIERRIDYIGILAFALLVIACFLPFGIMDRYEATFEQVAATFVLGAIYVASFLLGSSWCSRHHRRILLYLVIECALLTALLIVSPMRGFFFLVVLPVVSQAVFELSWKKASVFVLYLFAVSVGVIGWHYGLRSAVNTSLAYAAAFAFTIAFTTTGLVAVRARQRAEQLTTELESANQLLRSRSAEAEKLATIEERNRLAREIHDGVGHYLTVIKVQLDAASALLPDDPARAADSVAKAARLAGEALDDVRRSVGALAVETERAPLADALRRLAADAAPAPTLRIEGTPRPLSSSAEHALFRTAQEGLTNVRKHAGASRADLTLDFREAARVRLTLIDNGRGASSPNDPHVTTTGTGYGLSGLRERIALLNGSLSAGNRPEGGFSLVAEIPA